MTNYEYIKAMGNDEFIVFLKLIEKNKFPWDKAFSCEFCRKCAAPCTVECIHKDIDPLTWWLDQEVLQ